MSPQGPKENFDQLIRDGYTSIDSELARKRGVSRACARA